MNDPKAMMTRFHHLISYVEWSEADQERLQALRDVAEEYFPALVDDFYSEIERQDEIRGAITGGPAQVVRLKLSLHLWLRELFSGPYDMAYIERRWRVGLRHAEIGLPQTYVVAALCRLQNKLITLLEQKSDVQHVGLSHWITLNRLLAIDQAIIGDAYETEFIRRQREAERRQLSEILHREKELAEGLLNCAQVAVLVLDLSGVIVRVNQFFESCIQGSNAAEGSNWFERFLEPRDVERMEASLRQNQPTAEPATATSMVKSSDRSRLLHWSAVQLFDAAGKPFAILVIGHDITELNEAQQRSLQDQRLAAIGQMATGLAHESRNALQRIGASAEMLELEVSHLPAAKELVARIQQSQLQLHQLLDEVRNYAAPVILDRSPCRLSEVWREAWQLLAHARASKQATLNEKLLATDLVVEADRFRLVQVFRNLLENAIAASTTDVRIDLTCESALLEGNSALRVRVRDYGIGLTPEQRSRIFEPFYTTKPTGTGLGTSIAQRLVGAHGGQIAVGDNPGPGTEIVVTLPIHNHQDARPI